MVYYDVKCCTILRLECIRMMEIRLKSVVQDLNITKDIMPKSRYIRVKQNIKQLFCQLKRNPESFKS
jgi:hypothetical protein